jgi:Domain of unknown function (DUF4337)
MHMAALKNMIFSGAAALVQMIKTDKDARDKWIGVYIGVLAVLLAMCSMGGGNAAKDATRANIEATNTWNFFQAKNIRRDGIRRAAEELELQLLANPTIPAAAKVAYEKRIAEHRAYEKLLSSDPAKGEGLDEIFVKAKAIETERDVALRKDPYFDWGQALIQIGIVLASVCLITGSVPLLVMSAVSGVLGSLAMLNGFTLLLKVPGIG